MCEDLDLNWLERPDYHTFIDALEAAFKATKRWRDHGWCKLKFVGPGLTSARLFASFSPYTVLFYSFAVFPLPFLQQPERQGRREAT